MALDRGKIVGSHTCDGTLEFGVLVLKAFQGCRFAAYAGGRPMEVLAGGDPNQDCRITGSGSYPIQVSIESW